MTERVYRPPWWCRLHLYHRWRTYTSKDGEGSYRGYTGEESQSYQECMDCGKYRGIGFIT
jgi:hypothetical protein